jgi:hypothetical protein
MGGSVVPPGPANGGRGVWATCGGAVTIGVYRDSQLRHGAGAGGPYDTVRLV